jgi:hypothetical protein
MWMPGVGASSPSGRFGTAVLLVRRLVRRKKFGRMSSLRAALRMQQAADGRDEEQGRSGRDQQASDIGAPQWRVLLATIPIASAVISTGRKRAKPASSATDDDPGPTRGLAREVHQQDAVSTMLSSSASGIFRRTALSS